MGSGAEATEGQGSHNAAKYFGSHRLSGSPHDRHTRHSAVTYKLGSRGSVPRLRVQSHVHRVNPKYSFLVPTGEDQTVPSQLTTAGIENYSDINGGGEIRGGSPR
jgi:hypothetical protein